MVNVKIIAVGKLKEPYFREAFDEYAKRLSTFCRLTVEEVEQEKLSDTPSEKETEKALMTEAESILRKIPAGSCVIPMCIEGKRLGSEEFAGFIGKEISGGTGNLVFVIGGSFGLSDKVKACGKLRLSMSEMTFPHRLARIMLAEQLYRAFSILNNRKYHK